MLPSEALTSKEVSAAALPTMPQSRLVDAALKNSNTETSLPPLARVLILFQHADVLR